MEEKARLLFWVNLLIQTFEAVVVGCGYLSRFHLASDWSLHNTHSRNLIKPKKLSGIYIHSTCLVKHFVKKVETFCLKRLFVSNCKMSRIAETT